MQPLFGGVGQRACALTLSNSVRNAQSSPKSTLMISGGGSCFIPLIASASCSLISGSTVRKMRTVVSFKIDNPAPSFQRTTTAGVPSVPHILSISSIIDLIGSPDSHILLPFLNTSDSTSVHPIRSSVSLFSSGGYFAQLEPWRLLVGSQRSRILLPYLSFLERFHSSYHIKGYAPTYHKC